MKSTHELVSSDHEEQEDTLPPIPGHKNIRPASNDDLREDRKPAMDRLSSNISLQSVLADVKSGTPVLEKAQGRTWTPEALSVLLVEDNLINQTMLAQQLRKLGSSVIIANHGLEALDQLQKSNWGSLPARHISIVLMDWEMPVRMNWVMRKWSANQSLQVMDGLTCSRTIRKHAEEGILHGHVPILGITANVRQEQLDKALAAGMASFLFLISLLPRSSSLTWGIYRTTFSRNLSEYLI